MTVVHPLPTRTSLLTYPHHVRVVNTWNYFRVCSRSSRIMYAVPYYVTTLYAYVAYIICDDATYAYTNSNIYSTRSLVFLVTLRVRKSVKVPVPPTTVTRWYIVMCQLRATRPYNMIHVQRPTCISACVSRVCDARVATRMLACMRPTCTTVTVCTRA